MKTCMHALVMVNFYYKLCVGLYRHVHIVHIIAIIVKGSDTMRIMCLILVTTGKISVAMDTTEELFGVDEEHSCNENEI